MLLHEFLTTNRDALVEVCRLKVADRDAPRPTEPAQQHGIPLFLEQVIKTLRLEETSSPMDSRKVSGPSAPVASSPRSEIGDTATSHGNELLREGFTVEQVVHDYGDLCQAVTEMATAQKAHITVEEFRTFNRCLDNAIADAVTEFGRQRDVNISAEGTQATNERLGFLAHELRNLLSSAMMAFEAIKTGSVAVTGATGGVLERSLLGLRDLIDRSLAEVRLTSGLPLVREPISVSLFVGEIRVAAVMEAKAKGIGFTVAPVDPELVVNADRHTLASAVGNLLQNAFKFTRPDSHVVLRTHATAHSVVIEVEDGCGGLPEGRAEGLFQPFEQRGADRTGVGLGLTISRRGVEANGGTLRVRDMPGSGCVFAIELPRQR